MIGSVNTSAGGSAVARLWSETQEAVDRSGEVGSLPALAAPVAKVIGLLHVLEAGNAHLPASGDVIRFALDGMGADAVTEAIAALERATLIAFRRFKNSYKPYEGSDVDVEELLRMARASASDFGLDVTATAARLAAITNVDSDGEASSVALLPVVARRHLFETGTLRLFDQVLTRPERLANVPERTADADTDGTLLVCLARDDSEARDAGTRAKSLFAGRPDVIVGVLTETEALRETARTVELLLAVRAEHTEIERDRVASREWRERFADAQAGFADEWERLLSGVGYSGEGVREEGLAGEPPVLTPNTQGAFNN